MRWGNGKKEPKSLERMKLCFAWYPVTLYEGRTMWWEWYWKHRDEVGRTEIVSIFGGKKPK